jgi:putative exporter of polyketide antibiotics
MGKSHCATRTGTRGSSLQLPLYALQRWLLRLLLLGVAVVLLGVATATLDKRTLPGLRVAGVALQRTGDPLARWHRR